MTIFRRAVLPISSQTGLESLRIDVKNSRLSEHQCAGNRVREPHRTPYRDLTTSTRVVSFLEFCERKKKPDFLRNPAFGRLFGIIRVDYSRGIDLNPANAAANAQPKNGIVTGATMAQSIPNPAIHNMPIR